MKDDRVLPVTLIASVVVAGFLAAAGGLLLLFPADTGRLFAWPIQPEMTAMTLGAGYAAGAVFFVRAIMVRCWHVMGVAFIAATTLSTLMLIATVLHWEAFTAGTVFFWSWVGLYVLTPPLLPLLWALNRRRDPGTREVNGPLVPERLRMVLAALGATLLAAAAVFFVRPDVAIAIWPWTLSPLTARAITAFLAFVAVTWVMFAFEPRWSAHRLHVDSVIIGLLLVGVSVLRAPQDLTGGPVSTAVFIIVLGGAVVGLVSLRIALRTASEPRRSPVSP